MTTENTNDTPLCFEKRKDSETAKSLRFMAKRLHHYPFVLQVKGGSKVVEVDGTKQIFPSLGASGARVWNMSEASLLHVIVPAFNCVYLGFQLEKDREGAAAYLEEKQDVGEAAVIGFPTLESLQELCRPFL